MKYSIIIPAYNAEKTISRCLDSVLSNIYPETEIILINDGATDGTHEVCKNYSQRNECIKYISQKNSGVSAARNTGLEMASGEYVLFVDSDDYISADYFSVIDDYLTKTDADMLMFSFSGLGNRSYICSTGAFSAFDGNAVTLRINSALRQNMFYTLVTKTFRRDIIEANHIRFDTALSIGEDQNFIFRYAMHVEKIVSIPDILYYLVVDNKESLSRKKRDYLSDQLLCVSEKMFDTLSNSCKSVEEKNILYNAISWIHYRSVYSACMELLKYDLSLGEHLSKIRSICRQFDVDYARPNEFKTKIIALPVKLRCAFLMYFITGFKYKMRKD